MISLVKYLVGPLGLLALAALVFVDSESMGDASVWTKFLGRFHPVLLHMPIGLFAGAVLLEAAALLRIGERKADAIRHLTLASFVSTAFAAACGALLAWEGGYEADTLAQHKWSGYATCVLFFVLYLSLCRTDRNASSPSAVYWGGFAASLAALTWAGHQGGSLTHGSSFLTEHLPFKASETVVALGADAPVFDAHIAPVLKDYCVQCHGAEKVKGELRMDSFEAILAGGVNGPILKAGDSAHSKLIEAILLPIHDKDHMPPKGKPQLKADDLALLRWWIDQGADPKAKLADMQITSDVAARLTERDVLAPLSREEVDARIAALERVPGRLITYIAKNESLIEVSFIQATDSEVAALLPLKANIVRLNLANTKITDAAAATIGQMTNLQAVRLENTALTDAGAESLAGLYQLDYLNLYGTKITDQAIPALKRLTALRKVFLWQTDVTPSAVASLKKALYPELQAEQLRQQIASLQQERDRLDVEIVAGFATLERPAAASGGAFNIVDFMKSFHKGEESLASRAKNGEAEDEELDQLLKHYKDLAAAAPPTGEPASWKAKTAALISATEALIAHSPDAPKRYEEAVSCKACHSLHK